MTGIVIPGENSSTLVDELHAGGIHVWVAGLISTESTVSEYCQTLSDEERVRAREYRFPRDQQRFIVRRGILRQLLAAYMGCPPRAARISTTRDGKPEAASSPDLRFNLSCSRDMAVYAFAYQREVGIDIEYIDPAFPYPDVAGQCLSDRECARLATLPEQQRARTFFTWWARKEAYLKAIGSGLAIFPSEIEVLADYQYAWRSLQSNWLCRDLPVTSDFCCAMVIEGLNHPGIAFKC